jgi:hypothetical protein
MEMNCQVIHHYKLEHAKMVHALGGGIYVSEHVCHNTSRVQLKFMNLQIPVEAVVNGNLVE